MPSFTVDVTAYARDVFTSNSISVSSAMFGGIAVNHTASSAVAYANSLSDLGIGLIRWPGGTISENSHIAPNGNLRLGDNMDAPVAYDLAYPELFHEDLLSANWNGHQRLGLTAALQLASERQIPLSLTLPTERYADAPEVAYSATIAFLQRFFTEFPVSSDTASAKIIFDIGNENYHPESYAAVSIQILRAIREFREAQPQHDFAVALQAMQTGQSTSDFIQNFNNIATTLPGDNLLSEVDIVRFHKLNQTLSSIVQIEEGSSAYWSVKRLLDEVQSARASAVTVDHSRDIDVYVSAWTVTSNDVLPGLTSGLPAASAMLSLFSGLLELGADYATVWGIANTTETTTSFTHMVNLASATASTTPSSVLFSLMSHSISGARLLDVREMDNQRSDDFSAYAFTRPEKTIVYIAANEVLSGSMGISLDLVNIAQIASVEAVRLTASNGLSGEGVVTSTEVEVHGSRISVEFSNSYEVVQITINHAAVDQAQSSRAPSEFSDYISVSGRSFSIDALGGNDTVVGGSGDDSISGNLGNDYLYGGEGNDTLFGGLGDDFVFGGVGADVYQSFERRDDVIITRAGTGFYIKSAQGTDYVSDVETFVFSGVQIAIEDILVVSTPTAGDDIFLGSVGGERISLGDGSDYCEGLAGNDSIFGGSGDDTILGGSGSDWIVPGEGNNQVFGGSGRDFVVYGNLDTGVRVDLGRNSAAHGEGSLDQIEGIENVSGTSQSDILIGDSADNLLRGQGGRDTFFGSAGADTLDGGGGFDRVSYALSPDAVRLSLSSGLGYEGLAEGDRYFSIEMVIGSEFADTLEGRTDSDILSGRSGDDRFIASSGADSYYGGFGSDTIDYSNFKEGVRVFLNLGVGEINSANAHRYRSVENVIGTDFSDRLSGSAAPNTITGGAGSDTIYSYGGDDLIIAGLGDDFIRADAGNDTIYGGLGSDTVWAGSGIDVIFFEGRSSEYHIQQVSDRRTVIENRRTGSLDTVYDAEVLSFSDRDYLI